jgi:hypothetical protein
MAGDWIKMTMGLQSHPKVVRILSATKADKFRVIGGLHAVWSIFDQHSVDGELPGYTFSTMDHVIGWPGFAQAMADVGWLGETAAQTLVMPDFDTHNGESAKRRAEDSNRKRKARKSPQSVRNLSAETKDKTPDKMRTREEKRREDIKENKQLAHLDYSAWPSMPKQQTLDDWLAMRKRIKADVSQTVVDQFGKQFHLAAEQGITVDQCLAECIASNWRGFKFAWLKNQEAIHARSQYPARQNRSEQNESAFRNYLAEIDREAETGCDGVADIIEPQAGVGTGE